MFGIRPNIIGGTHVYHSKNMNVGVDALQVTQFDSESCDLTVPAGSDVAWGTLQLNAYDANSIYSGSTLQLPAAQTLMIIKT